MQDARFEQLLISYQNAVLKAQQEVEDGLAGFLRSEERAALLAESARAARRSHDLAKAQYREGVTDFTTVLDAERSLLAEQDSLASTMGNVAGGLVATYRALGGGWQIREGNDLVPPEVKEAMAKRTDWGGLLEPAVTCRPPPALAQRYAHRIGKGEKMNAYAMTHGEKGASLTAAVLIRGIFVFFSVTASACGRKPPPPPPPPTVTVALPEARHVTDYLELTGNTQAFKTVQLPARVQGYLDKILFHDGQIVKKDQLLFVIQKNTYEANLKQAEAAILQQKAQLDYAAAQLARYTRLVPEKAAAQSDVDNWRYQRDAAIANLQAAEAKRDLAKLDLGYTDVRSPLDGRIDRRLVDPGNLVGSGQNTVLASVNQIDPIYAYFNISDRDLSRLMAEARWTPGESRVSVWPVYLGLPTEQGYPHEGRLDFASISLTPTTGTLLLRAVFQNGDGHILPGLYAKIHLPVKERTALVVPEGAIGYDQTGHPCSSSTVKVW